MKKFSTKNLEFIPAGHEDQKNPGVLKKVIFTANDIKIEGVVQMINFAKIKPGRSFAQHYHEKMDEIFIILSGKANIKINEEQETLEATDTIYVPLMAEHKMENIGEEDLDYIAIGIVKEDGGKTIIVEK